MADDGEWKKLCVCPRCSKNGTATIVASTPIGRHFADCICGKCSHKWSFYSCVVPE